MENEETQHLWYQTIYRFESFSSHIVKFDAELVWFFFIFSDSISFKCNKLFLVFCANFAQKICKKIVEKINIVVHTWYLSFFDTSTIFNRHQNHTNSRLLTPKNTKFMIFTLKHTNSHFFDTGLKILTPAPLVVLVTNIRYAPNRTNPKLD